MRPAGLDEFADRVRVGTAEFKGDAHVRYASLRAQGPIHAAVLPGGVDGWLVVGYDLAKEVLTHPGLTRDATLARETLRAARYTAFEEGTGVGVNMLTADPPAHTRLRRLVASAFTPRRINALGPRIQQIADELLDGIVGLGRTDLVRSLTSPLPMTVISELLGVPETHRADFRVWSAMAMGSSPREHIDGMRRLNTYLADLLARKRAEPGEDLLSALVSVRDEEDGRLSDAELLGTAVLLVVAGQETTANLLGNAVLALLRHPEQAARLRQRPDLLPRAVEEFLRYDSPLEHTPFRFAAKDVVLGGATVRRGEIVVVALTSASRDAAAAQGADAERLDVERADARHLAFGGGIHYCLGASLARSEAVITLGSLLRRLPDLELDPDAEPISWIPAGITHGPTALSVRYCPT